MTDRECIVCRCISSTEAWSAECSLHDCACCHKVSHRTIFHEFHEYWCTCWIYAECKFIGSNVFATNDVCCRADIFESTTGTTSDDSLIHVKFSIADLALKRIIHSTVKANEGFLFYIVKYIFEVCVYFVDCINVRWMEWHCDHWSDFA